MKEKKREGRGDLCMQSEWQREMERVEEGGEGCVVASNEETK